MKKEFLINSGIILQELLKLAGREGAHSQLAHVYRIQFDDFVYRWWLDNKDVTIEGVRASDLLLSLSEFSERILVPAVHIWKSSPVTLNGPMIKNNPGIAWWEVNAPTVEVA